VQSVDIQALVVEVGSSSFRIGYSGEDTPRLVIPTAVGVVDSGMESQYFYGD
jgi:actin-related protein